MSFRIYNLSQQTRVSTLILLLTFALCQGQTVIDLTKKDLDETPLDSIDFNTVLVSEILNKSNDDVFVLKKLEESQQDTTRLYNLNIRRQEIIDAYTFFTEDKFSRDLSDLSLRELENLDRQWAYQKNQVEALKADYLIFIDRLGSEKKAVENITKFWEKYSDFNENIKNNAVLVEDLNQINSLVKTLQPGTVSIVNQVARHINSLNRINAEINQRITHIATYLNSTRNLFKQNASPYWNSFTKDSFSNTWSAILVTLSGLVFDLELSVKNFISTHVLVLLLFSFFYYMIIRIKKRLTNQTEFAETHALPLNPVFNHPLRSSIFIVFVFSYFIYLPRVPAIFLDIISIVAVGVLFLISRAVLDKALMRFIKLYIVFWFGVKLVEILTTQSLLSRTILIISCVYFLYWMIKFNKSKVLQKFVKNTVLARKLLGYYLKIAIVLTVVSMICAILGYMNMAFSSTALIVRLSLIVIFLYLWNPLFKRFLLLFIEEKYFKSRAFIYDNKEAILKVAYKIINLLTYLIFIYSLLEVLALFNPFMNWFGEILYGEISIGAITFSLWNIVVFFLVIILSSLIARVIQLFLQDEVLPKANLGRGFPETISMLVKYVIVGIGYFVAITSLGFEMSQLTIIFGALSVGIGFGLQNIFNNLVSGLILIFSRPIRIDDTIEFNNMIGRVNSIGVRSSNVRTFQGAEVIIPNGNLISNDVINWTLSDQKRRIDVLVGVAYGSDVNKVSELLMDILKQNEQVLNFPEPLVLFEEFADSSLNFRCYFWTGNIGEWMIVKSKVLFQINDAFVKADIEIPFPQRDVHMRQ